MTVNWRYCVNVESSWLVQEMVCMKHIENEWWESKQEKSEQELSFSHYLMLTLPPLLVSLLKNMHFYIILTICICGITETFWPLSGKRSCRYREHWTICCNWLKICGKPEDRSPHLQKHWSIKTDNMLSSSLRSLSWMLWYIEQKVPIRTGLQVFSPASNFLDFHNTSQKTWNQLELFLGNLMKSLRCNSWITLFVFDWIRPVTKVN